jgi:uncharacterized protein (TIGR02996 family)
MDVQAAILAAIADRPDDDTPRLAYADWLDDHAADLPDPDAARARADFIRVQCEVKRLEHLPSALQQGYADLYRRQDHLLTHHRRALLGPLADALGPHDAVFDRGFVTKIELDANAFLKHSGTLASLNPRPDISVFVAERNARREFMQSADLGIVTEAHWEPAFIAPEGINPLLAASRPRWDRLRLLNLADNRIEDLGLRSLAGSDRYPVLTELEISGNRITDEGIRSLVTSLLWPQLRVLLLRGNPMSDEGVDVLVGAPPTALQYLNVAGTAITRHGQQRLLRRKGWKVDLF